MKGGEPDTERACSVLIDDCKNGRIGRISLDDPAQAPAMDEERIRAASQSEKQKTAGRKNYKAGKSGRKASEDRGKPWKKK